MNTASRLTRAYRRRQASLAALSLLAAAVLGGCAHAPAKRADAAPTKKPVPDVLAPLPAQYAGTLPCGSGCRAIAYWLTLGPSGSYILQQHYDTSDAQSPADYVEVGGWKLDPMRRQLSLTPADADETGTSFWRVTATGDVVALDENATPISPVDDYTLHRRMAVDALSFTDTRWYLVNAPDAHHGGDAYIEFQATDHRLVGSTGCNRLMGEYQREDRSLTLDKLAASRRACLAFEDTEQSMLEALRQTRRARVLGNYLLLFGAAGERSPLAVFQARTEAMPLSD